jgi:hypothetical protein
MAFNEVSNYFQSFNAAGRAPLAGVVLEPKTDGKKTAGPMAIPGRAAIRTPILFCFRK